VLGGWCPKPPERGLQARPRAPHSPARSGTASRTASNSDEIWFAIC